MQLKAVLNFAALHTPRAGCSQALRGSTAWPRGHPSCMRHGVGRVLGWLEKPSAAKNGDPAKLVAHLSLPAGCSAPSQSMTAALGTVSWGLESRSARVSLTRSCSFSKPSAFTAWSWTTGLKSWLNLDWGEKVLFSERLLLTHSPATAAGGAGPFWHILREQARNPFPAPQKPRLLTTFPGAEEELQPSPRSSVTFHMPINNNP